MLVLLSVRTTFSKPMEQKLDALRDVIRGAARRMGCARLIASDEDGSREDAIELQRPTAASPVPPLPRERVRAWTAVLTSRPEAGARSPVSLDEARGHLWQCEVRDGPRGVGSGGVSVTVPGGPGSLLPRRLLSFGCGPSRPQRSRATQLAAIELDVRQSGTAAPAGPVRRGRPGECVAAAVLRILLCDARTGP